ncbi:GSTZ1.2 family protein [Megaselia abdita]
MSIKPILFSSWSSSCSWRVRIALHLKDIDFTIKPVNTSKGEHKTKEFQEINPMKHVPALKIDGKTLIESLAIINYLDEAFPQKPFLPTNIYQRAQSRAIADVIASGIQPLQNMKVLKYTAKEGESLNLNFARHWIKEGFESLEEIVSSSSGKFCVGNEVTIADIVLIPQVTKARQFKIDLTPFPTICRIEKDLKVLEAFHKANPLRQPDCPNDLTDYNKSFFE